MKHHHTTEMNKKCSDCNKPFLFYWFDAEENNGQSERMYGFDEVCFDCQTKRNDGTPPKTLTELNEERKHLRNEPK